MPIHGGEVHTTAKALTPLALALFGWRKREYLQLAYNGVQEAFVHEDHHGWSSWLTHKFFFAVEDDRRIQQLQHLLRLLLFLLLMLLPVLPVLVARKAVRAAAVAYEVPHTHAWDPPFTPTATDACELPLRTPTSARSSAPSTRARRRKPKPPASPLDTSLRMRSR